MPEQQVSARHTDSYAGWPAGLATIGSMPRANRRRPERPRGDLSRVTGALTRREVAGGRQWFVRRVRGSAERRTYRCPGCQQELASSVAHVVVWPADGLGGLEERRHWHAPCWEARHRRTPRGSWK
ncbi:MAG TPA: hypothetical protein VFJ12_10055 [Segeticoccus sp.]|nr:hypothetical protein [Segeticoccus sp.]